MMSTSEILMFITLNGKWAYQKKSGSYSINHFPSKNSLFIAYVYDDKTYKIFRAFSNMAMMKEIYDKFDDINSGIANNMLWKAISN